MKNLIFAFLLFSYSTLFCQNTISGKVVYKSSGMPLIGCSVYNVNTSSGTITNDVGEFEIVVNKGDKIQFSYIGFQTYIYEVDDFKDIKVQMNYAVKRLRDVVIRSKNLAKNSQLYNPEYDKPKEEVEYKLPKLYTEYLNARTALRSPITFLAAALNKRYQRKTQAIHDLDEMEYCEQKYSLSFISLSTGVEDEQTLKDIKAHCYFPREFIMNCSYYELGLTIKDCYMDFLREGKPYIQADSSMYRNIEGN